jgi:hypothetical protein
MVGRGVGARGGQRRHQPPRGTGAVRKKP